MRMLLLIVVSFLCSVSRAQRFEAERPSAAPAEAPALSPTAADVPEPFDAPGVVPLLVALPVGDAVWRDRLAAMHVESLVKGRDSRAVLVRPPAESAESAGAARVSHQLVLASDARAADKIVRVLRRTGHEVAALASLVSGARSFAAPARGRDMDLRRELFDGAGEDDDEVAADLGAAEQADDALRARVEHLAASPLGEHAHAFGGLLAASLEPAPYSLRARVRASEALLRGLRPFLDAEEMIPPGSGVARSMGPELRLLARDVYFALEALGFRHALDNALATRAMPAADSPGEIKAFFTAWLRSFEGWAGATIAPRDADRGAGAAWPLLGFASDADIRLWTLRLAGFLRRDDVDASLVAHVLSSLRFDSRWSRHPGFSSDRFAAAAVGILGDLRSDSTAPKQQAVVANALAFAQSVASSADQALSERVRRAVDALRISAHSAAHARPSVPTPGHSSAAPAAAGTAVSKR
ncbi:MAG: hypothetical protein HY552_00855 [Elusimicrobia bacterium]|nr:hypothetical protein [Elusimicrobiota bacterium]